MITLLLGLAGALAGLAGWACCGIGLVELGILVRFDPTGVGIDLPPPTTIESIVEWSFPVWCLLGAVALPKFVRWAARTPEEIEAGR